MGFSAFYASSKTCTIEKATDVVHHAVRNGATLLNTATFYGVPNEVGFGANMRLLKDCIKSLNRSDYKLMVKIGMDTRCPVEKTGTTWVMHGDAEYLKADVDYALSELGVEYLDIIVLCRVPSNPIEESVKAMREIVESGKAKLIGLSEANADNIRRAHAVHPIYCIEQEWSLWSRDIEESVVPTCRELGIKIVAYSPLGRGMLTGTIASRSSLDPSDYRLVGQPKFSEANFDKNSTLVEQVKLIAERKGCTVGQLALAWLHAQGPDVIPIPGTTSVDHLDQNLAARNITLSAADLTEINEVFGVGAAVGERYPGNHMTFHHNK